MIQVYPLKKFGSFSRPNPTRGSSQSTENSVTLSVKLVYGQISLHTTTAGYKLLRTVRSVYCW